MSPALPQELKSKVISEIPYTDIYPLEWMSINKWFAMEAQRLLYQRVQLVDNAAIKSFCHSIADPIQWYHYSNPAIHTVVLSLGYNLGDEEDNELQHLLNLLSAVIPHLTKITTF
jgi:hypothetical protein